MDLSFVICGIEHSGTTLMSDLFRQVTGLESGFECGVLLCPSPRAFPKLQPFFQNMLEGWKIGETDLRSSCETDSFQEFYSRLADHSRIVTSDTGAIFDKTPRYFSCLTECLSRTEVPFLCMFKDPRAIVYSDMQRAKPSTFDKWYEGYLPTKKEYLGRIYRECTTSSPTRAERVLLVRLEDLCLNARETLDGAFAHVGLAFEPKFVAIDGKRYAHNRGNSIVARMPFEYRTGLTTEQIARVERDFSPFVRWFYD